MPHHSLFSDKADLYASARPHYPAEVFDYVASLCEQTITAWDCACGNGQAAIDLVERFNTVIASDVSKEQIVNAKQHPQIDYQVSPSEQTNIPSTSVDLVCVAQALHWFDHKQFWPEVKRVLKNNGIFTAFAYKLPTIDSQIDQVIQDHVLNVIEPFWATENQLITDDYRDIKFPFEKIATPRFEMSTHWTLEQLFALIHTFSATRRCMDAQGDSFFRQAYDQVSEVWGNPLSRRKIDFNFVLHIGRNTRTI